MSPRAASPSRRGRIACPGPAGWGRLVASLAFERILARPASARTSHFALHGDLSTASGQTVQEPVDNRLDKVPEPVDGRAVTRALGLVVPKRHARRAVTRSLLKRQIRAVARSAGADLADGLWVVRLRAPFDRAHFTSAASDALRRAARVELETLFGDRTLPRRSAPCA
jgi:ribonuclease P protein component